MSRRKDRKAAKKQRKAERTPQEKSRMTRRRFLIGAGGVGALYVGGRLALREGRLVLVDRTMDGSFDGSGSKPKDPSIWFEARPDGPVVFHAPKIEMGQGIHSALGQIAAEELEVRWDQLLVVPGEPARGISDMETFSSSSVRSMYQPIREAAATMREMLCAEAAAQLGVPVADIVAKEAACSVRSDAARKLSYGQIVASKKTPWVVPKPTPALKSVKDFISIGKDMPRVDVLAKVRGTTTYAYDARPDGLLYGAVARPPKFGAKLKSAAPGQAAQHLGVEKVVIDLGQDFAGVVARTRTQARAAVAKLDLQWEGGSSISQAELEQRVTAKRGSGTQIRRHGDAGDALSSKKPGIVEASYRTPLAAHAHLEPISATVHVSSTLVEAWVPTQSPSGDKSALGPWAKGREVVVHPMQLGGSFGRKGTQTIVAEAARLSAAVGKPVHLGWTRHEEMQHSFYRQLTNTWLRGRVSVDGKIEAVEQVTASTNVGVSELPAIARSIVGFDFVLLPGLMLGYHIPNYSVRTMYIEAPVRTGLWRGVGLYPNVFALESFVDELAHEAKQDSLAFRLLNTPDTREGKRMRSVLDDVRNNSDWDTPVAAGRGRGVAVSNSTGTHVAMVAEVSVIGGTIVVERVTTSVDCGLVINPVNAALQAKGSIVMGISSTLLEQITVKDGAVEQRDFDTYPLLTLKQTPKRIDVHFIESIEAPQGMGEPVIGPIGAAIANAVFALTGTRARNLPLKV
jgi:isoquinoline 1-oxidoreductase subunit beta